MHSTPLLSSASSHNPEDSPESAVDSRTLAAAAGDSVTLERLQPGNSPSSTMTDEPATAGAHRDRDRAAAAAAAAALALIGPQLGWSAPDALAERFEPDEAAVRPCCDSALRRNILLDGCCCSVKFAIGLSIRGIYEIVEVKPANSICSFLHKNKAHSRRRAHRTHTARARN